MRCKGTGKRRVLAFWALLLIFAVWLPGTSQGADEESIPEGPWGISWALDLDGFGILPNTPADSPHIYIERNLPAAEGGSLMAIDRQTGHLAWRHETGERLRSSNLIERDGRIYVAYSDHRIWVLDSQNGRKLGEVILPPQRDCGQLSFCGKALCAVLGDFKDEALLAPTRFFAPALKRPVNEPEVLRYALPGLTLEKRHPIFRIKELPTATLWRDDILAVLDYDNTVEIYDNHHQDQDPIATYPLSRPERLLENEHLAWLDNNQLFVLNPANPKETKPIGMAARTQSLVAWREDKLITLRAMETGYELWRIDSANTSNTQRFTQWHGQAGLQRLASGNRLVLSDPSGFAVIDLTRETLVTQRPLPLIDALSGKPVLVGTKDVVFAADLRSRLQLVRLAPLSSVVQTPGPLGFSAAEKDLGFRELRGVGRENQWDITLEILRAQTEALGAFSATSRALEGPGLTDKLLGLLKSRERWLMPLALGMLENSAPESAVGLFRDLYYATQIRLKLPSDGASDAASELAETWPQSFSEDDLRGLARWLLDQLGRKSYENVAEIYRNRLNGTGSNYADQLASFRFLLSHYDQEESLLNRWFEARFRWERIQPALNRGLEKVDPAQVSAYEKAQGKETAIFFMDFPVRNSFWIYIKEPGAEKGRIYFTGVQLSQSYAGWLNEAQKVYNGIDPKQRHKAQAPITLTIKKDRAVISLFKPQAKRQFEVVFAEVMQDSDEDGWTDLEESILGLDPASADSDKDGLPDGMDANPLFAQYKAVSDAQMIAQAVYFHDCQSGLGKPRKSESFLQERAFLYTRFIDFNGIEPVELPSCGQLYLPPPQALKPEICSFVPADGQGPLDAKKNGNVLQTPDGQEAWIGVRCADKNAASLRHYHLRKLLKRWIVIDAQEKAVIPD